LPAVALVLALGGCGEAEEERDGAQGRSAPPAAPRPGAKAPAPGVPTSPGGDNSIQTWGVEAGTAERTRVTAIVRSFLDARAARRWAAVCSHLAVRVRREQERFGDASCPAAMASFAARARDSVLREEAEIEVLSLRVGRGHAFLIYRRPDGVWATALTREGGRWKVLTPTPNPIS
jgi:hypothetical protein